MLDDPGAPVRSAAGHRRAVVVGAGLIGVTTAHELVQLGFDVTVVADEFGSSTLGVLAAPAWDWPRPQSTGADRGHGGPDELDARRERWAAQTYRRLMSLTADPASGVTRRRTHVHLDRVAARDRGERRRTARIRGTVTSFRSYDVVAAPSVHPAVDTAYCFVGPVVDVARHLRWLSARLVDAGVHFRRRHVTDVAGVVDDFAADVVVNCTGVGASAVVDDPDLVARPHARVAVPNGPAPFLADRRCVVRHEGNGDVSVLSACPVGDTLVLGLVTTPDRCGTFDPHGLVRRCADMLSIEVAPRSVELLVGTASDRRRGGRMELQGAGSPVVHNYGHGIGSVSVAWAAAAAAAALALDVGSGRTCPRAVRAAEPAVGDRP